MRTQRKARWFAIWCACALLWPLAGCGGGEPQGSEMAAMSANSASAGSAGEDESADVGEAQSKTAANAPTAALTSATKPATAGRKIIYTATVSLIVESLSSAETKLRALVATRKGYLAEANVSGATGAPRNGTWKARVPVDQYDAFMSAVARLGEVRTINATSQDVSAEFYDLGARLANKKREERRLLQLLENRTARLQDVLIVEREISRVREEIERMQGRLNVLSSLSSLTTITVEMSEVKGYVPPKPDSFGTQIARSFNGSLDALSNVGRGAVLTIVALLPWLLVGALFAWPVWKLSRRYKPSAPPVSPPNSAPPINRPPV